MISELRTCLRISDEIGKSFAGFAILDCPDELARRSGVAMQAARLTAANG